MKIPSAEPLISDAEDWRARMESVKSTFSNRVGQISNAALRRGIVAYDENNDNTERQTACQDVEILAILTGLEIDSAKTCSCNTSRLSATVPKESGTSRRQRNA